MELAKLSIAGGFVRTGEVGGIEQYLYALLRGFASLSVPVDLYVRSRKHLSEAYVQDAEGRKFQNINEFCNLLSNRFVWDQALSLSLARKTDVILFPNNYVPFAQSRVLNRCFGVFHDLQALSMPENFTLKKCAWVSAVLAGCLRRSEEIIAISDFTRNEISRHFGKRFESKIAVIGNPIDWELFPKQRHPQTLSRMILSAGTHYNHKNYSTFLKAFSKLHKRDPDLRWIILGQRAPAWIGQTRGYDLEAEVQALGLSNHVLCLGHVSSIDRAKYFSEAHLLVHPSLYEGFGQPVVEAMGLELPVLTTRRGALEEVTRGKAQYVNEPLRVEEWMEMATEMLDNPTRYQIAHEDALSLQRDHDPTEIARKYLKTTQQEW